VTTDERSSAAPTISTEFTFRLQHYEDLTCAFFVRLNFIIALNSKHIQNNLDLLGVTRPVQYIMLPFENTSTF